MPSTPEGLAAIHAAGVRAAQDAPPLSGQQKLRVRRLLQTGMKADRIVRLEDGTSRWTCGTCQISGTDGDHAAALVVLDRHLRIEHGQ